MVFNIKTMESTVNDTNEKFVITDKPVMELVMDVLQILNKIGKITIKGNGDSCPTTVSVANIITQNILNGTAKTENISVNSEILDDGRLISTIEITITKISS
jgi:DNA-binding protein Alba|tara:strand:+ start:285 stop:590 length:306 start_codon:yes stop_codon:yes gene_type:complete